VADLLTNYPSKKLGILQRKENSIIDQKNLIESFRILIKVTIFTLAIFTVHSSTFEFISKILKEWQNLVLAAMNQVLSFTFHMIIESIYGTLTHGKKEEPMSRNSTFLIRTLVPLGEQEKKIIWVTLL
jgi:hypothetical protein